MLSKPIRNHGSIWRNGSQIFGDFRHIHGNIIDTACNRLFEQSSQGSHFGMKSWMRNLENSFRNGSLDSEIAFPFKTNGPFHQGMQSPGSKWMACIFIQKKAKKWWSSSPHRTSEPIGWVNVLLFGEGRQKCQAQSDETSHGLCQNKIPQKNRVENNYGPQKWMISIPMTKPVVGFCWFFANWFLVKSSNRTLESSFLEQKTPKKSPSRSQPGCCQIAKTIYIYILFEQKWQKKNKKKCIGFTLPPRMQASPPGWLINYYTFLVIIYMFSRESRIKPMHLPLAFFGWGVDPKRCNLWNGHPKKTEYPPGN